MSNSSFTTSTPPPGSVQMENFSLEKKGHKGMGKTEKVAKLCKKNTGRFTPQNVFIATKSVRGAKWFAGD